MLEKQTEEYQKRFNGHDFSYMTRTSRYPKPGILCLPLNHFSLFKAGLNLNRKARDTRTLNVLFWANHPQVETP